MLLYFPFPSDQSDFIEVAGRENDTNEVSEVNFYIDEGFTERVYSSCKDVVSPSTTGTVMDLMCGAWGSNLCTPRRDDGTYMRAEWIAVLLKLGIENFSHAIVLITDVYGVRINSTPSCISPGSTTSSETPRPIRTSRCT